MRLMNDQNKISQMLASDTFLAGVVLDAQEYEGTLVALVDPCISHRRIRTALEKHWAGDVEIHCATDMMVGGVHRD